MIKAFHVCTISNKSTGGGLELVEAVGLGIIGQQHTIKSTLRRAILAQCAVKSMFRSQELLN